MLLERNPLKGLSLPKEESPLRPMMEGQRLEAMLAVAPEVDWRFGLAPILAHETGHRIGSVRQLRWSDIDLERCLITWRKQNDKIGFEHQTPLSDAAVAALETARGANPAIGNVWVFPSSKKASGPCSLEILRDWWRKAEELAELERIPGLGWYGLRRKFATELKQTPLKDLCHLGGWKNPQTILTCYQKPDEDTMRQALESRKRLVSGGSG